MVRAQKPTPIELQLELWLVGDLALFVDGDKPGSVLTGMTFSKRLFLLGFLRTHINMLVILVVGSDAWKRAPK